MLEVIKAAILSFFSTILGKYVTFAVLIGIIGGVAWLAWDYRGAQAEREKIEAVNTAVEVAVKDINAKLAEEKKWRDHYQNLAEKKYAEVLEKIGKIKSTRTEITNNIRQEVERNPEFYNQPLPEKGYEQWQNSRSQLSQP